MPTFDQMQERHDNQLPRDPMDEPTEAQFEEAFDLLMQDTELLIDYIDAEGPDTTTIFQLIHQRGLPANHTSESDDALRDALAATVEAFVEGYRRWLGPRLAEQADQVRQTAIDEARMDAEASAADDDDMPY